MYTLEDFYESFHILCGMLRRLYIPACKAFSVGECNGLLMGGLGFSVIVEFLCVLCGCFLWDSSDLISN